MSTEVKKSRFEWIFDAIQFGGFMVVCCLFGIGLSMAGMTAAETVVDTRNNVRRVTELERRFSALEEAARKTPPDLRAAAQGREGLTALRP